MVVALVVLTPRVAIAQPSEHRSFSVYFENDFLLGGRSDSSYTNGIRLAWDILRYNEKLGRINRVASLEWLADALNGKSAIRPVRNACLPREGREGGTRRCGSLGLSIAQAMYTPSNIVQTELQVNDRPFAGLLFGSVYLNTLRHRLQSSTELQVGVIGPASGARQAQSFVHWSWSPSSAKPRGWDNQLGNAVQIGLVNTYQYRPAKFEWCRTKFGCNGAYGENRIVDLTPRFEGVLGTHMVRASGGAILRLGYRFPDAVGIARIPTTAARVANATGLDPWINVFAAFDQRAVFHNVFITGSSGYTSDERWEQASQITLRRNVSELGFGVAAGIARATIVVQAVRRSAEYAPGGGSHRFGSITFMLHTPPNIRDER